VLLPAERLVLRAMARIAVEAASRAPGEPCGEWVEIAIEVAIDELLEEQRDEERRGAPLSGSPDAELYGRLARILGVELLDARRACIALNGLSDEAREAFHAVVLEGRAPGDWAERSGLDGERVAELLREAGRRVEAAVRQRRAPRGRRRG
jgi:DNA-directed RNA polymerase specialized sigma24 family protein